MHTRKQGVFILLVYDKHVNIRQNIITFYSVKKKISNITLEDRAWSYTLAKIFL